MTGRATGGPNATITVRLRPARPFSEEMAALEAEEAAPDATQERRNHRDVLAARDDDLDPPEERTREPVGEIWASGKMASVPPSSTILRQVSRTARWALGPVTGTGIMPIQAQPLTENRQRKIGLAAPLARPSRA